jgi:ABC-type transport system involved in multi-copper enzyme maturation permease subunit
MFFAFLVGFGSLVSSTPHAAFGFLAFHIAMLCVVGTIGGAATLGHDRAQGSYDLLRASPLTPRQILRGKAAGVLTGLGFLAVIPLCHLLLCLLLRVISPGEFAAGFFLLVVVPAFWTGAGLAFGIHFARPQTAMARAAFALAMVGIGLPVLGAITAPLLRSRFGADLGLWLWDASPPLAVYDGLEWLNWEFLGARLPSSTFFRHWSPTGAVWCGVYAAYALFLWFFLPRLLARRLEREKDEG